MRGGVSRGLVAGAALLVVLGGACEPLDIELFPDGVELDTEADAGEIPDDAEPAPPAPAEAGASTPCAPGAQSCLDCVRTAACAGGLVCHPHTGDCVAPCDEQTSCSNGDVCNTELGVCVECIDGDACSSDDRPICDQRAGDCVECLESTDCTDDPEERPVCLTALGVCGCMSDTDCAVGSCGDGGECEEEEE